MPTKFQQETLKSRFAQAKVLVVGDVMLDRYWFGDVSRISPEAPVPVAKIGRIDQRAGGAANVARNIASLGGKAGLLSVTGDDEAADALDALMAQDGVASYLMRDKQIATTVKLRVVARNQQLIRLDFEEHPNREVLEQIKQKYREILPEYDAIIFSDYGKGGLSHISDMIDWAKHAGKTVLIDPKGDDYEKYAGATLITPNRAELKEVVGSWKNESELTEKAQNLRRHHTFHIRPAAAPDFKNAIQSENRNRAAHPPALAATLALAAFAGRFRPAAFMAAGRACRSGF